MSQYSRYPAASSGGSGITALTGDVTASGPGSAVATLANAGTAGTYTKVTTDAKGRVTSGTSITAADLPAPLVSTISAVDIDWSLLLNREGFYTKSISGSTVFTYSNVTVGQSITVRITSTGAFTVTFPATIKTPGGSLNPQTSSGTDKYTITCTAANQYDIEIAQNYA